MCGFIVCWYVEIMSRSFSAAQPVGEPQVLSSEIYELGWFGTDALPDGTTIAQKMMIGEVLATQFEKPSVRN